jgi:hypothetical protein
MVDVYSLHVEVSRLKNTMPLPVPWRHISGNRGIVPLIPNSRIRWRWIVTLMPPLLYPWEKNPQHPLNGLGEACPRAGLDEKSLTPAQIIQPIAQSVQWLCYIFDVSPLLTSSTQVPVISTEFLTTLLFIICILSLLLLLCWYANELTAQVCHSLLYCYTFWRYYITVRDMWY